MFLVGEKGYKKKASQLINAKGPNATSKNGSAIASNNNLSQKLPIVNTKYTQRSYQANSVYGNKGVNNRIALAKKENSVV